jgi:hypothetical protein
MRTRFGFIVALLASLVLLAPLAYADPPDQVWLGGLYDDDDQDGAVMLVTFGFHGLTAAWVEVQPPTLVLVARFPSNGPSAILGAEPGSFHDRSPPAVSLSS